MRSRLKRIAIGVIGTAAITFAADVSGNWNMHWKAPDGTEHDSTLILQDASGRLSGKITSRRGSVDLEGGSLTGNAIQFTVRRAGNGEDLQIQFQGKVGGETMKLQMQYRDHPAIRLVATRGASGPAQTAKGTSK